MVDDEWQTVWNDGSFYLTGEWLKILMIMDGKFVRWIESDAFEMRLVVCGLMWEILVWGVWNYFYGNPNLN